MGGVKLAWEPEFVAMTVANINIRLLQSAATELSDNKNKVVVLIIRGAHKTVEIGDKSLSMGAMVEFTTLNRRRVAYLGKNARQEFDLTMVTRSEECGNF